jgi:EAL domain-containing protein (putative c-di-GMP-specific phosphodiesterase class I)
MRLAIDEPAPRTACVNMLSEVQPDIVKLDAALIRVIELHGPQQAIVHAIALQPAGTVEVPGIRSPYPLNRLV